MRLASVSLADGTHAIVAREGERHIVVRRDAELGPGVSMDDLARELDGAEPLSDAEQLTFRPVVPRPHRIVCLGLNYRAHVEESGRELPTYPVMFTKWASSLAAAEAPIALPPESAEVDFEAELAVLIGKGGRRIPAGRAFEHIAGVTIANDITMRDYQYKSHQWLQGKAWDGSTPVGPYLVTLDEIGDVHALDIRLHLNDVEMQSSSTSRLIFDLPTIVATISEFTHLDTGDLILTGTPGGVGYRRDPKIFLNPGDRVTVSIDQVGELRSTIVAE
jgi:acylpyruvate hydrolase